ncbi:DUF4365 domain-containing protein [Sorangium sp. So ce296]|uniref:DUF4365 domain-containing protein n=1 Tax=Sorangium sp. So ce296 TaxID=3133296 RepID=UPI003F6107B0
MPQAPRRQRKLDRCLEARRRPRLIPERLVGRVQLGVALHAAPCPVALACRHQPRLTRTAGSSPRLGGRPGGERRLGRLVHGCCTGGEADVACCPVRNRLSTASVLPTQRIQEQLSLAYLRAVSARAGCTAHTPPDDFGVDLWIGYLTVIQGKPRDLGHQIGIQAKATTRARVFETHISYDLDIKAYNDLTRRAGLPRILVVHVMPEPDGEWMDVSEERLLLRRCAYWHDLRGGPVSRNDSTIRIGIPRSNRFNVEALQGPLKQLAIRGKRA